MLERHVQFNPNILYIHLMIIKARPFLLIFNTSKSNIINSMNNQEIANSYTSSNRNSWFQQFQLEGYRVPCTQTGQIGTISMEIDQKENQEILKAKSSNLKGYKFEKAEKVDIFNEKKNVPAPNHYFKPVLLENEVGTKIHESSSFKNNSRSQKKVSNNPDPFRFLPEVQKEVARRQTICKAEQAGFIESATLKGTKTPGPGEHNPTFIRHSSFSHFARGQKKSYLENLPNKARDIKYKHIGPETYFIPRSKSQICCVKLQPLLTQSDEHIKQRVAKLRDQKQKAIKTGPGKYLKIQEWCKYKAHKKISNGLSICSKPTQLKLYH